jgi:HEAT repeat protein
LDAISCGFNNDEVGARIFYHDPSPKVRAGALSALARLGVATPLDVATAIQDESPIVRRTVCELATSLPPGNFLELLADSDVRIIEACAFALGECEVKEATPALIRVATEHPEPLCRESAIAALGILGDELAREVLIGALDDIAQIRRRALIALSNFEGDDIDRAMRERLTDRDWQVRQAAEDLLGVNAEERR